MKKLEEIDMGASALTMDKARGFFMRSKVWRDNQDLLAVVIRERGEHMDRYTCAVYDPGTEKTLDVSKSYLYADKQVKDLMADKDMLVLK